MPVLQTFTENLVFFSFPTFCYHSSNMLTVIKSNRLATSTQSMK